jgi:hypothetical protein
MTATKVMKCGHCNTEAIFYVRAEATQSGLKVIDTLDYVDHILTTWRILECSVCYRPTLEETDTTYEIDYGVNQGHIYPTLAKNIILYPGAKTAKAPLMNLPETIEKKYLAALKVQDIEPSACAVLVGRTLEAVCNYEKATGKTLSDKVNNLVNSDRIPRTLAEMAHQLKQIRNFGAHDAEDEVTDEDVPIILDFLEAILEYLYVAPAKIAAVQSRLKKTP